MPITSTRSDREREARSLLARAAAWLEAGEECAYCGASTTECAYAAVDGGGPCGA